MNGERPKASLEASVCTISVGVRRAGSELEAARRRLVEPRPQSNEMQAVPVQVKNIQAIHMRALDVLLLSLFRFLFLLYRV